MKRIFRLQAGWVMAMLALCAPALALEQGRLTGTVVDEAGAPVADVHVLVTCPDLRTFRLEKTTDAHGQFNLIVVDATRAYTMRLDKAGFEPLEQPLPLKVEENVKQSFTLRKAAAPTAPPSTLSGSAPASPTSAAAAAPAAAPDTKTQAVLTFNEGVKALSAKDFTTARTDFEKAAALDPTLAPAQLGLAELDADQGKHADALAALDRYDALQPNDARSLRTRYDVLKAMSDPRAAAALDTLVAADHSHETAVRVFNHAADALRTGNVDLGIQELNRALNLEPGLEPAYSGLAKLYLSQRRYKEALNLSERWLKQDPGQPEPLNLRYQALLGLKDPGAAAAKTAAEAAAAHPPAKPLEKPAAPPSAPPAGAPPTAPPAPSTPAAAAAPPAAPAAPPAPEAPEAIFNRGVTLYNTGKVPEAQALFEQAVAAKPGLARAHYMLGLCYINANQMGKAREQLQEFLHLDPNAPEAPAAREMIRKLH